MNDCIYVYRTNGMSFPVYYDVTVRAWWTPRCASWFDTADELRAWADKISGAAFIA